MTPASRRPPEYEPPWRTSPEQDAAAQRTVAARVGRARHHGHRLRPAEARELLVILGLAAPAPGDEPKRAR